MARKHAKKYSRKQPVGADGKAVGPTTTRGQKNVRVRTAKKEAK